MILKTTFSTLILAAAGIGGAFAWQAHSHDHGEAKAKASQIVGQVVDIACFVGHDSSGGKHAKCAEACARAGNPLAIFDGRQLYLPISMNHKNPNEQLMAFIEKKVRVTGTLMEKAGLKGIAIDKVEPAR